MRLFNRAQMVACAIVLSWLAPEVSSAQSRPVPLTGMKVATVAASLASPPEALPAGLTQSRLQTLAELKLRSWALAVIPAEEAAQTPGAAPRVELEVTVVETRAVQKLAGYAYFARLAVTEPVASRNGALVNGELWSHSFLGVSDPKSVVPDLERSVGELLDLLINEWLKARR